MTSLRPDQISSTAQTFTSTRWRGSATARMTLARTRTDAAAWERLVLTAVGGHLWAHADPEDLGWWRDGNDEVDWVVRPGKLLRSRDEPIAIEVRAAPGDRRRGAAAFAKANPGARSLTVGEGGVPLEDQAQLRTEVVWPLG